MALYGYSNSSAYLAVALVFITNLFSLYRLSAYCRNDD